MSARLLSPASASVPAANSTRYPIATHLKIISKYSLVSLVKNTDCDNPATEYIRDFFLEKKESEDKLKIFTKEEKDFFTDYVRRIGQGDKKSQPDYLEAAEAKINGYIAAAEEADKKYRPLCIKLGFLFGLIILIILL